MKCCVKRGGRDGLRDLNWAEEQGRRCSVFNFDIAEGYFFVLDILENGQGDVIGKTMPCVQSYQLIRNLRPDT